LGALGSGIAFAVLAKENADIVSKGGSTVTAPSFDGPARDAQKAGQADVIVSGVSFAVAGLCAGGAIGLYILGNKIDKEARTEPAEGRERGARSDSRRSMPKLTLAPSLSPTGGGVLVAGRF
jgi:hypothetical protein